ncbi:DUF1836 domain-containing protein [Anaerovorax odorimutans]|uniref:DUF1836 domain-containing protein n=1 Tax=Anaerovorax odorimutans TaxID=109327 RepID=UPI0003F6E2B9|nr:DUF1836 domain-containing protein [Anaerovorax odorimutans]
MRHEEYMKNIIEDFLNNNKHDTDSFPDMDLYMDQVSNFMNKKLEIYKRNEKDKVLTKTMINNYVKHNLLPRTKNKKYNKDHLIILTLIYYLKNTFQMGEIEMLMKPIIDNYNSEFDDKIDLELLYKSIVDVQKDNENEMAKSAIDDIQHLKKSLSDGGLYDDDMIELFTIIVNLTIKADFEKYLAQKLLNEYFIKSKKQK